jgi:hypothetical protein
MQQMSSLESSPPQEMYTLGERYHMGIPERAYYVIYTRADIQRVFSLFLTISIIAIAWLLVGIFTVWNLFYFRSIMQTFFDLPFFMVYGLFIPLIWSSSIRRTWKNRPLMYSQSRQQRVYIYQRGLIKQTARRCEVVLWSQMYDIVYTPPQLVEAPASLNSQEAGIQFSRYGGRAIYISGALADIDDLAWRIKQACDQNRRTPLHTTQPPK